MKDHVIELLPWYVNGRLSLAETENVVKHLERCKTCATELDVQRALQSAINTNDKVGIAPQPSFNKLWQRIVSEQHDHESQLVMNKPAELPAALSLSRTPSKLKTFKQWTIAHWMPVAVITQSAAVIALATLLFVKSIAGGNDNDYRTVTDGNGSQTRVFHVVFDDATRLIDVKDILSRTDLQVVSGPTPAGVYSLTPTNDRVGANPQMLVKTLREDPRVRFAELSHE